MLQYGTIEPRILDLLKMLQPPAAALKKNADALDTTVDFLVNGTADDKVHVSMLDAEIIRYFKEVAPRPQIISAPSSALSLALSTM